MPTRPADTVIDEDVLALLRQAFDWARDGDTAALAAFLDQGGPVDLTNARGDTLLILAAYHDRPATVDVLLTHRAAVDLVNDNGQTALAAAVFRQSEATVRRLLAAGADPDAGPRSARDVASFFGLTEMLTIWPGRAGPADRGRHDTSGR